MEFKYGTHIAFIVEEYLRCPISMQLAKIGERIKLITIK